MLGAHPETGAKISVKRGPYGPFIEMERDDPSMKPVRASLPPDMASGPVITLEAALQLLQWPKVDASQPF